MEAGEWVTRWSVRAAIAFYFLALCARARAGGTRRFEAVARLAWTAGLACYLGHVFSAFHYYHDWSHGRALADTARQSLQVFGVRWGGGIFFNYAFTAVWLLDVLDWWRGLDRYRARATGTKIAVQSFFAFMVINGGAIFAKGPVRWAVLAGYAVTGVLWLTARGDRHRGREKPLSTGDRSASK